METVVGPGPGRITRWRLRLGGQPHDDASARWLLDDATGPGSRNRYRLLATIVPTLIFLAFTAASRNPWWWWLLALLVPLVGYVGGPRDAERAVRRARFHLDGYPPSGPPHDTTTPAP